MRMSPAIAKAARGDVIGVIDPDLLYDTEAVMTYAGIGEVALREEKRAGRITGYVGRGGRIWYRGADLIALITSQPEANKRRAAS